ncbi:MAG: 7-cyano-7-deazaguanine synthase QueC [Planctomycetota bacterium]|nr:7-cyano-7-deazaguanine synthase QueC [Planctomycetota bacterium]
MRSERLVKTGKTVVTFSGGIDSTTLLYQLLSEGCEVLALSIDYGQRHRIELEHAARIAGQLGIRHEIADLSSISRLLAGSSLTGEDIPVPLGHYEDESMKQTVVPNRNMLLLAVAAAWAISEKADSVAYAAHSGDHAIYPDCRSEFADALGGAIALADWHKVELLRPFVDKTKEDITRLGAELEIPFELTWSCYQGGEQHCGACGTCIERREAFLLAGIPDPTQYDSLAPALLREASGSFTIDWNETIEGKELPPGTRQGAEDTA